MYRGKLRNYSLTLPAFPVWKRHFRTGNRSFQGKSFEFSKGTCKFQAGTRKFLTGSCKSLIGSRKSLTGTCKFLLGTRNSPSGIRKSLTGSCESLTGNRDSPLGSCKSIMETCNSPKENRNPSCECGTLSPSFPCQALSKLKLIAVLRDFDAPIEALGDVVAHGVCCVGFAVCVEGAARG